MYSTSSSVPSLPSVRESLHGFGSDALLCDLCGHMCLAQQSTSPTARPTGEIGSPKDGIAQGINEAQIRIHVYEDIEREMVSYIGPHLSPFKRPGRLV
jgi:hypothetical protein